VNVATAKYAGKPVLVKSCYNYGADAHRILAAVGLALVLHSCFPICGLIVMDLIRGLSVRHRFLSSELPPRVFEDVRRAIGILHDVGLVFGDLRRPNIMVIGSGEKLHAMLVDFDWARPAGTATYPPETNNTFVLKR